MDILNVMMSVFSSGVLQIYSEKQTSFWYINVHTTVCSSSPRYHSSISKPQLCFFAANHSILRPHTINDCRLYYLNINCFHSINQFHFIAILIHGSSHPCPDPLATLHLSLGHNAFSSSTVVAIPILFLFLFFLVLLLQILLFFVNVMHCFSIRLSCGFFLHSWRFNSPIRPT